MVDEEIDDQQILAGPQCHFFWHLVELFPFCTKEGAKMYVEEQRDKFNECIRNTADNLFRPKQNLMMAYVMFMWELDGWDKMIDNALRLSKTHFVGEPSNPLYTLPEMSSPLWTGPSLEFFSYIPESSEASKDPELCLGDPEVADEKNDDLPDDAGVIHTVMEHVALSLKAEIFVRRGVSDSEIQRILKNVTPTRRMFDRERATMLSVRAETLQMCGPAGLPRAINLLRRAVLIDPDNLELTLKLIQFKGYSYECKFHAIEWSEVESVVDTIDAILRIDFLKPELKTRFRFEKLQLLVQYLENNRLSPPKTRRDHLTSVSIELSEVLIKNTDCPKMIVFCALFLSRKKNNYSHYAIMHIEKALIMAPKSCYVNSKACAFYRRQGDLEKAVQCAQSSARSALMCSVDILELNMILGRQFNAEEFFEETEKAKKLCGNIEDLQKWKRCAFLYYLCLTDERVRAIEHFKSAFEMGPTTSCLGNVFCTYMGLVINVTEAAYCLVLLVRRNLNESDRDQECFGELQKAIEQQCDVNTFQRLKQSTPEKYVEDCRRRGAEWLENQRQLHHSGQAHVLGKSALNVRSSIKTTGLKRSVIKPQLRFY